MSPQCTSLYNLSPEPRAPALKRRYDLAHIVADQAEPRVPAVLLYDPPQRELGVVCHGVALVEEDQLGAGGEELTGSGKLTDLVTDNVNSTLV